MNGRRVSGGRVTVVLFVLVGTCALGGVGLYVFGRPLLASLRAQAWRADPQQAAEAAHALVAYELPQGYQESEVLSVGQELPAVIITSRTQQGDLILISHAPNGIVMRPARRASFEERGARTIGRHSYDTHTVSTQEVVIRGQLTTLRFLEGTDETGRAVRQLACMFAGSGSDVLLIMVAGQDTWDQALVDRFLQSIR